MTQITIALLRSLLVSWMLLFAILPASAACDGRIVDSSFVLKSPLCVPLEPKRIVALDPTYSLGMALDLGLPVVGASMFGMSDKTLRAKAESLGVQDIGSFNDPNIETIIALKPDLIIGSAAFGDGVHDMLSPIAPTVLIGADDWKKYFGIIADVAGQSAKGATAFQSYDRRVAEIKKRIPDTKVSVLRITAWDFQVYLDGPDAYGPFAILRELGVVRSPYETVSDNSTLKRPDWEQLEGLNGDTLLYIIGGGNNSDTNGRHEEVLNNPLWQMLPAVKAGRVHRVDAGTWMEFSGLTSANRVLDDVERYIATAP